MYTKRELNDMILDLRAKILDMKDKIEGMNETLDDLVAIKNKLDESKKVKKRWRAEDGGNFFSLSHSGSIIIDCQDYNWDADNYRYSIGNYFKTYKEAELYKQKQLIRQELEDLAMEISTDPTDLNNHEQYIYYIYYDICEKKFTQGSLLYYRECGSIPCTNEKFLKVALERIGEEKLKILFGANNE